MKSSKIYTLLDDITKIQIIDESVVKLVYLSEEPGYIKSNFLGLVKQKVDAKPERWIFMYGDTKEETIQKYDTISYWRTRDFVSSKEYRLDETTKKVYKKAYVSVEIKNKYWQILEYFNSTKEAKEFAQNILNLTHYQFV